MSTIEMRNHPSASTYLRGARAFTEQGNPKAARAMLAQAEQTGFADDSERAEHRALSDANERAANGGMTDAESRADYIAQHGHAPVEGRQSAPIGPSTTPLSAVATIPATVRETPLRAFINPQSAHEAGKWLMATLFNHERSMVYCRDHGIGENRAMATNVNVKGGFIVPDQFETAIIRLVNTYGVARSNCHVYPMDSDHMVIPRSDSGPDIAFVGEGLEITPADSAWSQVGLTAKKLAAMTRISSEIAEDAVISLAEDLAEQFARSFAQREDACCFIGDGTALYAGMVGLAVKMIDGTHEVGSVEAAADHDLMSEIDSNDLATVIGSLPDYAAMNAKWYCSRAFKAAVFDRLLLGAGGATVADLTMGYAPAFLGYPIVTVDCLVSDTTTDYTDLTMAIFGDLSQGVAFGDRRGITIKVDESRYLEYDQLAVRGTERFDINAHGLGDNTDAGPVVALVGGT